MPSEKTTRRADQMRMVDALLGGSTRPEARPRLRYVPAPATPQQQEVARSSALYQAGDMRLVWINEGDLACMVMSGEAVSYGRD